MAPTIFVVSVLTRLAAKKAETRAMLPFSMVEKYAFTMSRICDVEAARLMCWFLGSYAEYSWIGRDSLSFLDFRDVPTER